jgi:hypothetical protein
VEREVSVADLVISKRVEVLVEQPDWVVVMVREGGGKGVLAGERDNHEIVFGIGNSRGLGPKQCDLAYLDDIYILSPDDSALEQTLAFFDERQPSIRLNQAKCKTGALEDIRSNGLRMLGTCMGAYRARERFLQEKINREAPPSPSSSTCPTSTPRPPCLKGVRATEPATSAALPQVRRP